MDFDTLDKQMRSFEQSLDRTILPGTYIVARLDGHGFTRLTKKEWDLEKPFDTKELVARVKAVLRRFHAVAEPAPVEDSKVVEYPGLIVNISNYSVTYRGNKIDMPPKELELLFFLCSSANQVFTREQLLENIWGYDYLGDTRTVDVHVKRLREKIKDTSDWRLATVWGIGYKFETR